MNYDYKRHGVTTFFAALNILTREVLGRNMQRFRDQEFIHFLNAREQDIEAEEVVHEVLDYYAAHNHEKVRDWLARCSRWTFHFTPTTNSWLSAVEDLPAKRSRRRLRHGVFCPVAEPPAAINYLMPEHIETEAKPSKPYRRILATACRKSSRFTTPGWSHVANKLSLTRRRS